MVESIKIIGVDIGIGVDESARTEVVLQRLGDNKIFPNWSAAKFRLRDMADTMAAYTKSNNDPTHLDLSFIDPQLMKTIPREELSTFKDMNTVFMNWLWNDKLKEDIAKFLYTPHTMKAEITIKIIMNKRLMELASDKSYYPPSKIFLILMGEVKIFNPNMVPLEIWDSIKDTEYYNKIIGGLRNGETESL